MDGILRTIHISVVPCGSVVASKTTEVGKSRVRTPAQAQGFFLERHQLLPRALNSVGKQNSTRVDEGRKCRNLLAIKTKARTVVGRGEKSLLCDPGSELRLWRERDRSAKIINGMKMKKKKKHLHIYLHKTDRPRVDRKEHVRPSAIRTFVRPDKSSDSRRRNSLACAVDRVDCGALHRSRTRCATSILILRLNPGNSRSTA